jgi:hypothetical protein
MSRVVKRVAAAFVIAMLTVSLTAVTATADGGGDGSAKNGPRCCF